MDCEIYFSSTLGTVIFPAMDPESGASLPVAAATSSEREENVVQHVIHVLLEKLKTLFEAVISDSFHFIRLAYNVDCSSMLCVRGLKGRG